jgi:hypothetical protein
MIVVFAFSVALAIVLSATVWKLYITAIRPLMQALGG